MYFQEMCTSKTDPRDEDHYLSLKNRRRIRYYGQKHHSLVLRLNRFAAIDSCSHL